MVMATLPLAVVGLTIDLPEQLEPREAFQSVNSDVIRANNNIFSRHATR